MKELTLTKGYVALVDDADYVRVSAVKWCANPDRRKDGSLVNVYAKRHFTNKKGVVTNQILHRIIMGVSDPKIQVDHIDHNGLNCQRHNLRVSSNRQNACNQRKHRIAGNTFKGVSWRKDTKKWRALIKVNGKSKSLGSAFATELDAAIAYDAGARLHFGEFACLNFPDATLAALDGKA